MAIIPIKVLKDKNQEAFLPFTITDAVFVPDTNKTLPDVLNEQEARIDEAIESVPTKTSDLTNDSGFITNADVPTKTSDLTNDSNFVSDANYVHTDSNYTDNEKSKLAGITAGAEVNVLEKVKVNGTEQTITNKAVDITVPTKVSDIDNDLSFINNTVNNLVNYYTKTEIDNKVSSVYKYQGSVNSYSDLPSSGQVVGDVYNVVTADTTHGIPAGGNVAWNGTAWDYLGGDVDFSNYYTKAQVDTSLNSKVDKVTGKQLSTEDYTSAEKTKLANIEANAAVNLIESISVNNTTVSPVNKNVNITIPTTLASLTSDATHRTVSDTDIDNWNAKQDELVSSVNIRTINGTSILGSGNITIGGSSDIYQTITTDCSVFDLPTGTYRIDADGADVYIPIDSDFDFTEAIDPTSQDSNHTYIKVSGTYGWITIEHSHTDNKDRKYYHMLLVLDDPEYAYTEKYDSNSGQKVADTYFTSASVMYFPDHRRFFPTSNVIKMSTPTEITELISSVGIHHFNTTGFIRNMFTGFININDADITMNCLMDGGSASSYTFPKGSLFCFNKSIQAGGIAGLLICSDGRMYKITGSTNLELIGTTIKPYVDLTSNQTIGGVKTFSSVPVCATQPTSNNELANKAYVDAQAGGEVINIQYVADASKMTTSAEVATGKFCIENDGLKYPVYSKTLYIPHALTPTASRNNWYYYYETTAASFVNNVNTMPTNLKNAHVIQDYSYLYQATTAVAGDWHRAVLNSDVTGYFNFAPSSTTNATTLNLQYERSMSSGYVMNFDEQGQLKFTLNLGITLKDQFDYAVILFEYTKYGEGVTP